MMDGIAAIHFIHETRGMLCKRTLNFVPRVGDEVRLSENEYYKVTLVMWVFDEPDNPFQRVNIGLIEIPEEP